MKVTLLLFLLQMRVRIHVTYNCYLLRYFQLSYWRHNNILKLEGKYYVFYICSSRFRLLCPNTWEEIISIYKWWDPSGRVGSGVGLRPLTCWKCGFNSFWGVDVCPLWVLCVVQVGVGLSSVQRSPTVRDVSNECDYEDPQGETMTRKRVEELQKKKKTLVCVTCSEVSSCCPKCVQPDPWIIFKRVYIS